MPEREAQSAGKIEGPGDCPPEEASASRGGGGGGRGPSAKAGGGGSAGATIGPVRDTGAGERAPSRSAINVSVSFCRSPAVVARLGGAGTVARFG